MTETSFYKHPDIHIRCWLFILFSLSIFYYKELFGKIIGVVNEW